MKRRTFIKAGSVAGATLMMPGILSAAVLKKSARIGFIGVGLRGRWMKRKNDFALGDDY